ncbi:MAG: 2-amino-4-hydroxy-6-hydroxymethyldihydropteridine diphosphokinase [Actinomycetota bacterium]|nr:2-amino-4-hydroxy-6-hydroxymethyldihydropteridine diphosphokinase [Actinomycetota bacterium]
MTNAYVGVGSNVGDRASFCRRAVDALRSSPRIVVVDVSSLYETSPLGGPPQRSFVNLVVRLATDRSARELLELCKGIERRLGREPGGMRWGPRVADLDILIFGEEKVNEADLEIPHPRLTQRRFALVPLLEIDPAASDPWGARYADFLEEAEGETRVLARF